MDNIRGEYWLVNIVDNNFIEGAASSSGLGSIYELLDGLIV